MSGVEGMNADTLFLVLLAVVALMLAAYGFYLTREVRSFHYDEYKNRKRPGLMPDGKTPPESKNKITHIK